MSTEDKLDGIRERCERASAAPWAASAMVPMTAGQIGEYDESHVSAELPIGACLMAGSYRHVLHGWSLIENMGDANEAVEELMWLVEAKIGRRAARRYLDREFYPMKRRERAKTDALMSVEKMMER